MSSTTERERRTPAAGTSACGRWVAHVVALAGFVAVAIAFSWPLAVSLDTHLLGPPTGDTGVYVWNQWVFRHELVERRGVPYFTDTIFAWSRPANLSLHNYTTFQNLVALPLIPVLGVVATFNVVYLLSVVLTAYAMFLLAHHVTGRGVEAWLAGVLFAWSPMLVARSMDHQSLVAAAPIPLFLLVLLRAADGFRVRDACLLGASMWWAASTDVYYAVYCLLLGILYIAVRLIRVERAADRSIAPAIRWGLDVLLVSTAGLIVALAVSGGWELSFLGFSARMHSLYTPVLLLTLLILMRARWYYRASVARVTWCDAWLVVRFASVSGVVAAVLLSPVLYAAGVRLLEGHFQTGEILWRSSPSGMDLLALVLPNPHHPLAPQWIDHFLARQPMGFIENVGSLPLVALATVGMALRRGWRAPRWWAGMTIVAALLALGPFLRIAGVSTYVPGPWALLRYAPLIGLARSPTRLTILVVAGLAVLFAAALVWLGDRKPARRRVLLAAAGFLLAFELWPVPRTLHSAAIPSVYAHVAAVPGDFTVLELPFGIRDGTGSVGDFSARTQFFQTAHGKRILGGYLSRVSRRRVQDLQDQPVLAALALLSERRTLAPDEARRLVELAPDLARRHDVRFVVIDRARASDELRALAIRAFRLEQIDSDPPFELYRPKF